MKFTFSTPQLIDGGGPPHDRQPRERFRRGVRPEGRATNSGGQVPDAGWAVIARPVFAQGLVFIQTGYTTQHIIAIDPTGSGDITAKIAWKNRKDAPNTPTPLAVTARNLRRQRRRQAHLLRREDRQSALVRATERRQAYSASPILADGLLYVTSEEGVGQVVKATKERLSGSERSDLKEKTFATFVPGNGALFVRTETQVV